MLHPVFQNLSGFNLFPEFCRRSEEESMVGAEAAESGAVATTGERGTTFKTRNMAGSEASPKDAFDLSREAQEIRELQLRDREVKAHEAAHAAAGGAYAGSPSYTFKRGPDGKTYATGGEVSIDVSPVAGDPEATLQKAQQIQAAALAPAEPSAQDMKVAQRAQAMAADARMQIADEMAENLITLPGASGKKISDNEIQNSESAVSPVNSRSGSSRSGAIGGLARLDFYA